MSENVFEFSKNHSQKIVFSVEHYLGRKLVHIRTWIHQGDKDSNWTRTHKGICVSISCIADLKKGIELIAQKIESGDL